MCINTIFGCLLNIKYNFSLLIIFIILIIKRKNQTAWKSVPSSQYLSSVSINIHSILVGIFTDNNANIRVYKKHASCLGVLAQLVAFNYTRYIHWKSIASDLSTLLPGMLPSAAWCHWRAVISYTHWTGQKKVFPNLLHKLKDKVLTDKSPSGGTGSTQCQNPLLGPWFSVTPVVLHIFCVCMWIKN